MKMKKFIQTVGLASLLSIPQVTQAADGITSKIDPASSFAKEARLHGLDPDKTSTYEMVAVRLGLPKNATPDQIIKAKYGLKPKEATPEQLNKLLRDLGYTKVQDLYPNLLNY